MKLDRWWGIATMDRGIFTIAITRRGVLLMEAIYGYKRRPLPGGLYEYESPVRRDEGRIEIYTVGRVADLEAQGFELRLEPEAQTWPTD